MTLEEKRYIDSGKPLGAYAQNVLAICPSCHGPALVQSQNRYIIPFRPENARVHCLRCSFLREQEEKAWFGPVIGHACERCPNCGYKWLKATEHRAELNDRQRQAANVECTACHRTAALQLVWYRESFGCSRGSCLWSAALASGPVMQSYSMGL